MSGLFSVPYLNTYLRMVEDTESPRIFHIWSAIFAISASLGRRCKLPFGTFDIYPNHYVLFVGTPGTRKTTASSLSKRLLMQSTGVRFAPSDTGFQRQGLIKALQGNSEEQSKEFLESVELGAKSGSMLASLDDLSNLTNDPFDTGITIDNADKHVLAIVASEFSRVVGQNNMSMMDFLGERYDGEDFEYQTKETLIKLKNTLMNMLACTTPVSIANALPPQAGGQGFLSRIILVYGAKKYKNVPRPMAPHFELVSQVKDHLQEAYALSGEFDETKEARAYCESLYDYVIEITDSRFAYYTERRFTHLLKLGMVLAAARGSNTICKDDFYQAHTILRATEIGMPDALGEFGMNPLGSIKQTILDKLRTSDSPLEAEYIMACFHRDASSSDITEVINELVRAKLVKSAQARSGKTLYQAIVSKQNTEDSMMDTLREMMQK